MVFNCSIRRSSDPYRETYWVALAMGRNDKNPSFALDHLSGWPKTRKALLRGLYFVGLAIETIGSLIGFRWLRDLGFKTKTGHIIMHNINHYGLAVELDAEGKVLQSLHSPDGRTTLLSEVREVIVGDRKVLYLGSYANNYIGKMTLGLLAHLNRPLLTHEKKQYIEQQKKRNVKKGKRKYVPYEPFDLQNPQFGPQNQKQNQQPDFDYDMPQQRFKPPKSKKTKKKSKSKKTGTKSNGTKTTTKQTKPNKMDLKHQVNLEPEIQAQPKPIEPPNAVFDQQVKKDINFDSKVRTESSADTASESSIKDHNMGQGMKRTDQIKSEL